jgi:DNA-binding response OmpR family regulator
MEGAQRLSRALPSHALTAVVPTAYAALQAIRIRMPTLIVTELDLPDANGVELVRRIHLDPATRKALLMVVSQRNSLRDKIAAFEAGADDYLVKPQDPQNFLLHAQLLSRFGQVMGRQ